MFHVVINSSTFRVWISGCAAGTLTGIFKTMSDLFGNVSGVTEIQYLELLPIDDKVKTVSRMFQYSVICNC